MVASSRASVTGLLLYWYPPGGQVMLAQDHQGPRRRGESHSGIRSPPPHKTLGWAPQEIQGVPMRQALGLPGAVSAMMLTLTGCAFGQTSAFTTSGSTGCPPYCLSRCCSLRHEYGSAVGCDARRRAGPRRRPRRRQDRRVGVLGNLRRRAGSQSGTLTSAGIVDGWRSLRVTRRAGDDGKAESAVARGGFRFPHGGSDAPERIRFVGRHPWVDLPDPSRGAVPRRGVRRDPPGGHWRRTRSGGADHQQSACQ